ncbi:MAG: hypothetical protein J3Q66DRAFT_425222 [Benniella sp.]|nr:MAG: hypothetical protein J3Q66DRAFT_425222 [Benniella sp.]
MWKCFGLSEQEVRKALEDAKDRFHKDTKQVTNLTLEQCDKALSDAVNTLDQVKKKGHGTLKKDHILRGETAEACSKLKELQDLKDNNKVQVSLKFAEEWRFVITQLHRYQIEPFDVGSLRSIGNTSRSSKDSWDIPNHDQIREADNASRCSEIGAHDEEQSASSSQRSSRSDLSAPCIIQSDNDGRIPHTGQSIDNPASIEGISSVPFPREFNSHEGFTGVNSSALPRTEHSSENLYPGVQHIFTKNVRPPVVDFKPPKVGERLGSIHQLVTSLFLLQEAHSLDDILDSAARQWFENTTANADEQERLKSLAIDVIRAFKRDEFKDAKVVAEVVYLAPILERSVFRELINIFDDESDSSDPHLYDGFAQLIRGANAGCLDTDDFYMILGLIRTSLNDLDQQSHIYQLILTVSHVLDAMADAKVSGFDSEMVLKALSPYLDPLKGSSDPHLVYQAAYAYQALQCVPDDETLWQEAFQRTSNEILGVPGLMSAVKGLDLDGFIDGLKKIQQEISGTPEDMQLISSFVKALKEGSNFNRKTAWYPALRGADMLIRDGQFVPFKRLVVEAPCRLDPAFQWGLCQRLGEIAADPFWGLDTCGSAIALLGEIYRNDEEWGQLASIKQWILIILMQLSGLPENGMQAKAFLEDLKTDGDAKKQELYLASLDIDPSPYPLKVASPIPTSSILLRCVQAGCERILDEDEVVYSCAYSPDGELFAIGLASNKITVYRTPNWERIQTLRGHTDEVNGVTFSPASNLIASASDDDTVKLWDVGTGSILRTLTGHSSGVLCVAYSPRGDQVASGSGDKSLRIWDADTGSCLRTLSDHEGPVLSVAYSPHGKQITSGSADRTVRLWDVNTGVCVRVLRGHDNPVRGVAYSYQVNRIASIGDDKRVRVWDVDTRECLSSKGVNGSYAVAFSPKCNEIACGGQDATVKLWDMESESFRTLSGHSDEVRSVVYSPSGNQLASGSRDGTVRIWFI